MRILFLDDNKARHISFMKQNIGREVVYVYTSKACIEALNKYKAFDLVSLDHDLGGKVFVTATKGHGMEVANYIANELPKDKYPQKVIIHSWNIPRAVEMYKTIKPTGIPVVLKQFTDVS